MAQQTDVILHGAMPEELCAEKFRDDIPLGDYQEGQKVRFLVVKSGTDYVLKQIESAED
jgi:hypothetical protein